MNQLIETWDCAIKMNRETVDQEAMWRKTDKGSDHLLEKANFDEFSNCIHIQVLYIKF